MRAASIWAAAALLGLGGAIATSQFSMGAPPTTIGLVGLAVAVLLTAAAAWRDDGRLAVAALVLLGIVVGQDYLRPGVSFAHDLLYHAWALYTTWLSVLDGDLWPRWNPYLGLGMPLLQFYCPVGYAAAWPAQALGASPVDAVRFLVVGGAIATACTTYASARWAGGSRPAGLLAAAALSLAPYHLMDQTFRLALGELLAFAWLPPIVVASWKVARGERGRAPAVLGVCLALLLGTHILSVITIAFALLPVTVWTLARGSRPRRRAGLVSLALCAALTIGSTAAWWLPIVVEQEHTSIAKLSPPGKAISAYAATIDEPVRRRLWRRYDIRYKRGDRDDPGAGMPMYFGCVLLALTLLAVARRRPDDDPGGGPPVRAWGLTALATLLLATWPAAMLLDVTPLLGRIMFPWRLYAPASVLAALAIGLSLDRWLADRGARAAVLLVAVGALAFDVAPYLGAPERYPEHEGFAVFRARHTAVPTTVPRGEFTRVEMAPLPPAPYDYRVALTRRVFPEYMAPPLRDAYTRFSKTPSREASEAYGVGYRYSWGGSREQRLEPDPLVWFRPAGGEYAPLPEATWTLAPELLAISLPPDLPDGSVRFVQGWFPGWRAQVDDGAGSRALRSRSLLAAKVPAGATSVEFRYSAFLPLHRTAGIVISLLSLAAIGLVARRRRRRTRPE